jgi:hypothetical protein
MTTQVREHRYSIRTTPLSQFFLIPFGVSKTRSYVQIRDGELHVRFGPMFDERIPLATIEEAKTAHWPRWAGVGPRTNFRGTVALIGAYDKTVRLTFKEPMRVHLFVFPMKCHELYLSLEDPHGFLKAIGEAPAEDRRPAKAA